MNSYILKLILLSCIILQTSCGITFKRKVSSNAGSQVEMSEYKKNILSKKGKVTRAVNPGLLFSKRDSQVIVSYYLDKANAVTRQNIIKNTKTSKKQTKNLVVDKIIPRDIQVIPLPLTLERILSSLPLNVLRVQVGTRVILMNVKSRRILDIINI